MTAKGVEKFPPDIHGNIYCTSCKTYKPVTKFATHNKFIRGYRYACRLCETKYAQTAKYKEIGFKSRLKTRYNLTVEEYKKILISQNNSCAICKQEFKNTLDTHTDHNHIFKFSRGLLCSNCNPMIGYAKEDINILQAAIDYLHEWEI